MKQKRVQKGGAVGKSMMVCQESLSNTHTRNRYLIFDAHTKYGHIRWNISPRSHFSHSFFLSESRQGLILIPTDI